MATARPEILVLAGVNGAEESSVTGLLARAIDTRANFAFESTLGATTIPTLLKKAATSHDVHVLFVGLDSPERHIARVAARVRAGGHDIPDAKIRSRYTSSRANLIDLLPFLASLRVYDNSTEFPTDRTTIPLPTRLLEMKAGAITYEAPRGSIPDWAKAIVQAARELVNSRTP